MHSDSHINDDIFASATTTGRTSKFNPKPRINIKKALPKSSKSGADEDPSSTSKFPSSEDIKCPVEGSLNASYEFHSSSVALPAHNVLQSPESNADCSVSSNVLDEVPQLDIGESQEIGMGTDVSSHLGSLDGSILTFSTSASTVGGCQLNAITPFESRESEQPANLDQVVGDSIEVLTDVYGSLLESSSETYPAIKPPRSLEVVPLESAHNEANASQAFANFQDTEETTTSSSLDDSLFDINARSGRENKFQPKLRQMIVKCISASSDVIKTSLVPPCAPEMRSQVGSRLGLSTVVTSVSNTCNFEVHELPESSSFLDSTFIDDNDGNSQMDDGKSGEAPDLFANVETPNVNIKQTSTSVLSEPEVTHSPIVSEEFAAHQEASYSSEGDANLHINDKLREGPTTGQSGLEPLDDMLLQSELPAVKQIGKFQPKSALRVGRKKAKSVSFILPNDGESAAAAEHQPEMTTSRPIERITSFVEMMSDQNINDGTSSSLNCYKNDQVDLVDSIGEDVMGISGLDTLEILSEPILSEPILNSDQHACKSKLDLQAKTKNAKINAGISPDAISSAPFNHGDIESGLSVLDSLSINSESLGAHGPDFPSGDLIESFAQQSYNCVSSNFSVEGTCLADNSDLGAQSLGENQELHNMEGETIIDHFEERDVERCTPSIVQDDEAGKSSRRYGLRNRKLKSSVVDNTSSEYQNFENTRIPEMDVENSGNGYQDEDVMKKKKRKATRKSNSTSSEHERSIKSRKKASEEPDSTVKDPPKKRLPHGSRRKSAQRQVNKSLLEIPDDELDRRQLVIRDLIRLAGFKERVSNKDAAAMKNYFTNQSNTFKKDGHLNDENYDEVPEQGTTGDDKNEGIQQEAPKLNYHTYMRRPQQTRWSKTDTELFYQAIRQFGSDFAMVQLLFPNRSRLQVKAKFKNEQRKHPLQIADALVYRSKDHSHFEKVIQHLQEVAEQKSKNEASSDPTTESQDVVDDNEEEGIEANKKEQDPTGFEDAGEWSSLKSNVRDGDDHTPIDLSGYEDCF